jgi:hypothetical protein
VNSEIPSLTPIAPARPWLRWVIFAVLLAVLAAGAYAWKTFTPYPRIGSVYIAKQYCSCLFVAGRSEASCRAEFKPNIDTFKVKVDRSDLPRTGSVEASLLIFSAKATYDSRYGCTVAK